MIAHLFPILITAITGILISIIYFLLSILYSHLSEYFTSSITIDSSDILYQIVLDYLKAKNLLSNFLNNLTCKTDRKKASDFFWVKTDLSTDRERPELIYNPGLGNHAFIYKGKKIFYTHFEGQYIAVGYKRVPSKVESLTLTCSGSFNIGILKSLCEESLNYSLQLDKGNTVLYSMAQWGSRFEKLQSKKKRPLNTVILQENVAEELLNDIKNFQTNSEWYFKRGVPYRRGYLFYGPPGSGKTSLAFSIAGELNYGICTINLTCDQIDDEKLNRLLEISPINSIILIEDIDLIFIDRLSVRENKNKLKLSFSGLLNAIDGVRSKEGKIIIMTTNQIEKLDPALLRPGRSDLHIKFDYAKENQIKKMFQKFYKGVNENLSNEFVKSIPENKISMASLQGHFLVYKDDPISAIKNAKNLIDINEYTSDMLITDWLFRLGLEEFSNEFMKENIYRVADLKKIEKNDLEKYGVKILGDKFRIMNMIKGDEKTKKAFDFLSKNRLKNIVKQFVNEEDIIENIVKMIPEFYVTEFMITDCLEEDVRNYEKKIKKLLDRVENFKLGKKFIHKKNILYPKKKPKEILERLKLDKFIEKFQEENALNEEVFYSLNDQQINQMVNSVGGKIKLKKIIKNFNEHKINESDEEENNNEATIATREFMVIGLAKMKSINY